MAGSAFLISFFRVRRGFLPLDVLYDEQRKNAKLIKREVVVLPPQTRTKQLNPSRNELENESGEISSYYRNVLLHDGYILPWNAAIVCMPSVASSYQERVTDRRGQDRTAHHHDDHVDDNNSRNTLDENNNSPSTLTRKGGVLHNLTHE